MVFNENPLIMFSLPGVGLNDPSAVTRAHVIVAEFSPRDYYLILCAMDKTRYGIPAKVVHSLVINDDLVFEFDEERRSVLVKQNLSPFKFDFPDVVNYWAFVKALTEAKLVALEMSATFKALHQNLVHAIPNIPPTIVPAVGTPKIGA